MNTTNNEDNLADQLDNPIEKAEEENDQKEVPSDGQRINLPQLKDHLQSNTGRYIILGIILFFLFLCVITRPDNTGNFFYYTLFLMIWPVLIYLVALGIDFLRIIYVGAMVGSGAIAIIAGFNNETGIAVIAGAISLTMLAIVVAVGLCMAVLIFGPGALVGTGINHLLGDSTFSGIIGFIVFLVISFLIAGFVMKIAFPFGFGLFIGMFSGAIARDIVSYVFSIRQARLTTMRFSRILDRLELDRLSFSSIGETIGSVINLIENLFKTFYIGNWLIILGSIALGIYFVVYAFIGEEAEEKYGI